MKIMKKLSLAVIVISALFSITASAKNNVSEIDISVTVRDDGSAYIVQNWSGEFYEGTENYIPIATGDITISDLRVSDEEGEYILKDNWDVNADFEDKARKCGINETYDGVELCFGISEYGEKRYAIEYIVTDFIKSYNDYDGCNFMFINPNMSTFPTDGHINILLQNGAELNETNAGIWGFGYDGYVEFQDGKVSAYTTSELQGENSMIVMLRLNKGLIFPETSVDASFDTVKDKAFEGSDYGYGDAGILETIIGFIILLIVSAVVVVIIVFFIKRKKAIKNFYKQTEYYRDVPNNGKIQMSHYLAQTFDVADEESLIIGALILSMINKGFIEPVVEEKTGLFGKVKQSVNLVLKDEPDTATELSLYSILKSAAGENSVLQEKELENYAYINYEKINNFIDGVKEEGKTAFVSEGGFANGAGNCIKNLSEQGKTQLAEVMGLKKYLNDFSLIAEREITETIIWKDYMVYATLFGIADKVIKQLETLYPEKIPEFEAYNRNVIIANSYYHSIYHSTKRAIQQQRTSGGGGRTSFGGGGGFSGGGFGGGSR